MALVTCKNQEKYPLFSSFNRKKSFQSSQFSKCILGYYFSVVFQAEDGIRDAQESRGLGDVYKRQTVKDFH